jgi:hypothetical protein
MRKTLKRKYFFLAVPFILILVLSALVEAKTELGSAGIVYFGVGCLALYITTIISLILVLTPGRQFLGEHTEEIGAILLAAVLPAIVIAVFAIGWDTFHQFVSNLPKEAFTDLSPSLFTNSFYISAVTFTSTGYGDFVPVGWSGRWYAMIEAFIGHVHAAVFFGLMFSRVERWRNLHRTKITTATALRTKKNQKAGTNKPTRSN